MITKEKGERKIVCDECGSEDYGGTTEEWSAFWAEMKDKGWRAYKADDGGSGTWEHLCPDCERGVA